MKRNFDFNKERDIQILSEEYAYEGFFKIKKYFLKHRLFSGEWSDTLEREVFERPPVAAALPYDPRQDKVILIEQFRSGAVGNTYPWLLEIVAGVAKEGESPEHLIKRELVEESGLVAKDLYKMFEYWVSPGGTNEFLTLFCAHVDAPAKEGVFGAEDEGENIYVHVVDTEEAFKMLDTGQIKNAISITSLLWLRLYQEELKKRWL